MGPGQYDMRRHRAERDRLVLDLGKVFVGRPIVRHQHSVGGHGTEHESVDLVLAEALDHLQPGASWHAAVDFDRACDEHLAHPTQLNDTLRSITGSTSRSIIGITRGRGAGSCSSSVIIMVASFTM